MKPKKVSLLNPLKALTPLEVEDVQAILCGGRIVNHTPSVQRSSDSKRYNIFSLWKNLRSSPPTWRGLCALHLLFFCSCCSLARSWSLLCNRHYSFLHRVLSSASSSWNFLVDACVISKIVSDTSRTIISSGTSSYESSIRYRCFETGDPTRELLFLLDHREWPFHPLSQFSLRCDVGLSFATWRNWQWWRVPLNSTQSRT